MYEQDIILGPLTFKQFITIASGSVLSYYIYKYSGNYIVPVLIILAVLYVALFIFKNPKIPLEHLEEYFKEKKAELGPEEFERMLRQRIANIASQINDRLQKGLVADPVLEKLLPILERILKSQ